MAGFNARNQENTTSAVVIGSPVDSLAAIRRLYRPRAMWWLMGMDNLAGFANWRRPEKILRLARLAVANREELLARYRQSLKQEAAEEPKTGTD